MKTFKSALVGMAFGGSLLAFTAPASAAGVGISVAPNGAIGFSLATGGYCDRWGCPGDYWNYPVYYGPIYYEGTWYRGPMYYRTIRGERYYWVRGGWRRDHWRGPRP
ncbi:MAG: hypothetical protein J0H26_00555, partial [Alphaproteobacteria bacterium]|nr:hypothetical protein [Alphaproteobacteria bacterium]